MINVTDAYGISHAISFYVPARVQVTAIITINPLLNYTSAIGGEIITAVAAYINGLPSGVPVMTTRLYVPANLAGPYAAPASANDAGTFELTSIVTGVAGGPAPTAADLPILYYQQAVCLPSNITLVV